MFIHCILGTLFLKLLVFINTRWASNNLIKNCFYQFFALQEKERLDLDCIALDRLKKTLLFSMYDNACLTIF